MQESYEAARDAIMAQQEAIADEPNSNTESADEADELEVETYNLA